jgi:hypothetical protein
LWWPGTRLYKEFKTTDNAKIHFGTTTNQRMHNIKN